MPATAGRPRPHVVLVTGGVSAPTRPAGALAQIIRLASEHVDFTVISSRLPEELKPFVSWRRAPAPGRTWGRWRWAVFFVTAWIRLRGVRADLIHTVAPAPLVPPPVDLASVVFSHAAYHSALGGRPPRGLPGLWRLSRAFSMGLERACYRRGRVRILGAECASSKRTLARFFPDVDVAVVPFSPIDGARFRPDAGVREELRRAENVEPAETVALFVGGDLELKGLGVVIEGLAEATRLGSRVRLWVLGSEKVARYKALAARAAVGDRVRFFGVRDDIERFYQAADVLVLPTLCETFCRVAYEAAATTLPVVATAVDGVTELVGESEAGLLVDRDARSVGQALARLAGDPELRRRLGEEGRRRALERTLERSVNGFLDAYERLLADRAVRST